MTLFPKQFLGVCPATSGSPQSNDGENALTGVRCMSQNYVCLGE